MGNCNKKWKNLNLRKISTDFINEDKTEFEFEISNLWGKNLTKSNSYIIINI